MDYSGAARFDLLARQGAVEIEVECKTTSGDTGRKIHRQEVNRLADLLLPITEQLADTTGCAWTIRSAIIRHRICCRLSRATKEVGCK
jgi:hypothetical protein